MSGDIKNFYGETIAPSDVKFFFVYCPNNSGSTALTQYVGKQLSAYIPPHRCNEGQALGKVRAIFKAEPKWGPKRELDWPLVRKKWA